MLYNFLTIQLILKAKVQTLVNNNTVQPIQRVSNLFQHNTKLLTQFNNKLKLQLIKPTLYLLNQLKSSLRIGHHK